jgi:hypothetical protein
MGSDRVAPCQAQPFSRAPHQPPNAIVRIVTLVKCHARDDTPITLAPATLHDGCPHQLARTSTALISLLISTSTALISLLISTSTQPSSACSSARVQPSSACSARMSLGGGASMPWHRGSLILRSTAIVSSRHSSRPVRGTCTCGRIALPPSSPNERRSQRT